MNGRVADEIAALRDLDQDSLRRRWRMLSGKPAPLHLPRALLVRLIAYRLQANAFGDLDPKSKRLLDGLAKAGGAGSKSGQAGVPPRPELRPLLPGTHLVREHEGVLHRVMVLEEGFAWNGGTYRSLSQVAREITGTRWNGHRFFGLQGEAGSGESRRCTMRAAARPGQAERQGHSGPALRHLHPRLDRPRAGAGLQLARCAARSIGGLHQEPGA